MLNELLQHIEQVQSGASAFDDFELWFEQNCNGMFGEPPKVLRLCLDVESALSNYRFDHHSMGDLRQELAAAVRPFEIVRSVAYESPSIGKAQAHENLLDVLCERPSSAIQTISILRKSVASEPLRSTQGLSLAYMQR